jgi:hypothetical protein
LPNTPGDDKRRYTRVFGADDYRISAGQTFSPKEGIFFQKDA